MFDMSTAILHNTFKTTTPLIDVTVNETLSLSDYRSLQFFHRVKCSSVIVIDSLLKGTTNNTRLRSGLFGPWGHMSGLMKSTFCFSDSRLRAVCAGAPSCGSVHL